SARSVRRPLERAACVASRSTPLATTREVRSAMRIRSSIVTMLCWLPAAALAARVPHVPDATQCNVHFVNARTFTIPGRGLTVSWAPAGSGVAGGHAIAVGGHLIGAQTYTSGGERYDAKIFDTTTGAYLKRFGVHYWWV